MGVRRVLAKRYALHRRIEHVMQKTALITGVNGQDGAYLTQLLLDKGYTVYGAYRRTSSVNFWRLAELGLESHPHLHLVEYDLTDQGASIALVQKIQPDEIYNLAAQSFVGVSFEQPATTAQRLQMGVYPVGAEIIPNPFNRIPGFSIHNHFFVPGFPVMAWPMVEWVLDTQYRHLFAPGADIELTVMAEHAREGDLIDLMQQLVAEHPAARLSSLPSFGTDTLPPHIEFGFTGQPDAARAAMAALTAGLQAKGYVLREVRQR